MAEPNTRRRDAATASTGAVLLGSGGVLRHAGVHRGFPVTKPKVHALAMLRAAKGKRLFWGGSAIGALGLPPLAVGTTRLVHGSHVNKADDELSRRREAKADKEVTDSIIRNFHSERNQRFIAQMKANPRHQVHYRVPGTSKLACGHPRRDGMSGMSAMTTQIPHRISCPKCKTKWLKVIPPISKADDHKHGFWREGLSGTREALGERAQSYREPVPSKLRVAQAGVGAGAGALGSLAARAALGRRGKALKPLVGPVAGGLAATASVPLTNRYVHHRYPEYEITPAGVRRRKKTPVKPSKMSSQYRPMPRSLRQDMAKAARPVLLARLSRSTNPAVKGRLARLAEDQETRELKRDPVYRRILNSDDYERRSDRKSINFVERFQHDPETGSRRLARPGLKTSMPRLRSLTPEDRSYLGIRGELGRGTGQGVGRMGGDPVDYELTGNRRVRKADSKSYQGSRTPYFKQRAAITAAGHPPVIGPFTQAAAAARYAPPGQERKEALRQYGMASAAGLPIGAAGAYGGAHLARHSKTAEGVANDVMHVKHAIHDTARRAVGLQPKQGHGRLAARLLESKAGAPFRTKAGAAGGAAGFLGAKMASGAVLGQAAISLNQRDQRRYNKDHGIHKSATLPPTKRERHQLATRKRRAAALSTISGAAGLGSLGLLAAKKREPAILIGTVGSGVGGVNSLLGSQVQRQEANAIAPVKKHVLLAKASALAIEGDKKQHDEMIRRYGDRGSLPKHLSREEKMRAYEARYVYHGGDKANKWQRRAKIGSGVKNAGLAGATAAGVGYLARHPHKIRTWEGAAAAAGTIGGAGELLNDYARHKQASYANSPGGVAASALRRMRDYTPNKEHQ